MTELPVVRKYTDAQGVEITFFEWPVVNPKAVVQLVHGLGEHARRYDHVATALNRAGYSVYADDHRGHGQTGKHMLAKGQSKHVGHLGPGGMRATYQQVYKFTQLIQGENPNVPLVLLGHSWGSMISQWLINHHSSDFAAAVLSASTLLLPGILPAAGFNKKWDSKPAKSGFEWLSRNESIGHAFTKDPLNFIQPAVTAFGALEVLHLAQVPSRRVRKDLPLLLLAGSDDPIGGERGNKLLANAYRRAGVQDLKVVIYHDGRHEMFNETNQDEVLGDVVEWIDSQLTRGNKA
jgi:alpha-beta hydrolase superfamily lysophospholipase